MSFEGCVNSWRTGRDQRGHYGYHHHNNAMPVDLARPGVLQARLILK
jgi:hypothetical protein